MNDAMIFIIAFLLCSPIIASILCIIYFRIFFHKKRSKASEYFSTTDGESLKKKTRVIAFFHPHCSAGGGGERVLWKAIQNLGELQNSGLKTNLKVAVYTTDPFHDSYKKDILHHVSTRFSIQFPTSLPIIFIHLPRQKETRVKMFSLLAESWSTIELAWMALHILTPHVFIDTTGCSFTFIVARILANCKIGAYVHYPTISTDMLSLVWDRRPTYNNDTNIAANPIMTYIKLIYYILFALCYGFVGSLTDLVMVNSSWTYGHISSLWRFARRILIVYPPCDTQSLDELPLSTLPPRENIILSIGQFRPEKDHSLQIRSFANLIQRMKKEKHSLDIKLVLIGSCRGTADEERVKNLKELSQKLKVLPFIEFVINQPFPVLKSWLGRSSIGIHTMWNEHFGIGVVEMMAAGLITIAHNTGGPKLDIVVPFEGNRTGYLAYTAQEYSDTMYTILFSNTKEENEKIRENARRSSKSFSDEVFDKSFKSALATSKLLS